MKYFPSTLLIALTLLSAGCLSSEKALPAPKPAASSSPQIHVISKESENTYLKAVSAYGVGDHLTALEMANDALSKDENNYKALSLKGIIQAFDISPEEGIKTIKKSLAVNPDYVQAFFDMAMAQKLGKHYDESIFYFQKVIEKDPGNTWSYYGIATDYADKKDKNRALEYLKKAIELDSAQVKPQARIQDHFSWLHDDPDFLKLVQ